jgi:YD repeat-containing protein
LTGIVNPVAETTTLVYDPLGRTQRQIFGNGMTVSQVYDPVGNTTALQNRTASGTPLVIYTATYDNVGNRMSMAELDGSRTTFSYDPTYQLTNENRSGTNSYNTSYQYDSVGNRQVMNDSGSLTTYTYNAGNQMTLVTPPTGQPTTVSFDLRGNCTVENTGGARTTYAYNDENQLTSTT